MIAVLFGRPGSGKGTQAAHVSERFGLLHVGTGDMLRREVTQGTELGREVQPIMEHGGLVSDDLMLKVIVSRLEADDAAQGVLLDGFPRTVEQARALDEVLEQRHMPVDIVLHLLVPEDKVFARLKRRAEIDGRKDDSLATVTSRLAVYDAETFPVLDYYAKRGTRVEHLDGDGTIEEVSERIDVVLSEPPAPVA
ncbi:MAG: adenylate kinase [Candidatus Dormibacteria bacterium]